MEILGVRIDEVTRRDAQEMAREFLHDGKQHTIFTPNPEMLVDAQTDEEFKHILNSGSLNICDGKGVQFVSRGRLKRIPGIDFMVDICRIAEEDGKTVFLFGSMDKVLLEKTVQCLKKEFLELKIVGIDTGPVFAAQQRNSATAQHVIDDIIDKSPDILFVGFGHGKQEKWIAERLPELPSVKIAMGVGGAFDILGGKFRRAPRLFCVLGLEWVWRFLQEPRRFPRIFKATFLFLCFTIKRNGMSN